MLEFQYLEECDSIFSSRPLMAFVEKGIDDWMGHKMSPLNRDPFKPEYLKLNPEAQVRR